MNKKTGKNGSPPQVQSGPVSDIRSGPLGYFSFLLHMEIPYFRTGCSSDHPMLHYFFQVLMRTVLPLINTIDELIAEGVQFRIVLSFSPVMLTKLEDKALLGRFTEFAQRIIQGDSADFYHPDRKVATKALELLESYEWNPISKIAHFQEAGYVEIMACPATHAYLPLLKTEESLKNQISVAVNEYKRHFGIAPRGMWLPESGYTLGVDRLLKPFGIDFFIADAIALKESNPRPNRITLAPLMTPYGVQAFARDADCWNQICSPITGYSRDANYLYNQPSDHQEEHHQTGIETASKHAAHFLQQRLNQTGFYHGSFDRIPHILAAYDANRFGIDWHEGMHFLRSLIMHAQSYPGLEWITPAEYLERYPIADTAKLKESAAVSFSGNESLLHDKNEWIYRHLHQAEDRMALVASNFHRFASGALTPDADLIRCLNQCVRELLLAQCGSWATGIHSNELHPSSIQSVKDHLGCFHQLAGMIETNSIDLRYLEGLESRDGIFETVDYRDFLSIADFSPVQLFHSGTELNDLLAKVKDQTNVFMLSWEYPPKSVGGLSVAVRDLSEALAKQGKIVHVVTSGDPSLPGFEIVNGVHIHRIPILYSYYTDFIHWQFEMNMAMIDHLISWRQAGGRIDLIHAHDWMVYTAAKELKSSFDIPMVCTIHATEWGRNQGVLYSELQKRIHKLELQLTHAATKVFVCSEYMRNEVEQVFGLPPDKIEIIHNGVPLPVEWVKDLSGIRKQFTPYGEKIIFYVGRLVYEKGVQSLIDAMPSILDQIPDARLVIAGTGSMETELKSRAVHLGSRVKFLGYIDDQRKNELFQLADVCVIPSFYEPFGIVALETMRYRRPLVISDTGGMKELIEHGLEGYKALPGNIESLSYHITDLILHPKKGQEMAERAYLKLERHFGWEGIAARLTDAYKKLQIQF